MGQIINTTGSFLGFLKSLKKEQPIPSYYKQNTEMIVVDIDLEKKQVRLRQSNLSEDFAKWFSEIDFVNGQLMAK